ncbi:MAG TPA: glycosyltransferase family 2 protein [Tepidisphaeraceae bacterium]|jgi:cellulose synthase/poly-beta-1,6-N-acetylglucosamine synthase-like glycosyltransferase
MRIEVQIIFWVCVVAVGYAYAVYPSLIYIFSRGFGHPSAPPEMSDADLPTVTLLIAAHNEEAVIEGRIANALELDYPKDRLQIVIASDRSDDRTVEIANHYRGRVRVLDYPIRRGKAATLNSAIEQLTSEIIMFSDANTWTDRASVRHLVRWFADESVGAVCGKLILTDPPGGRNVDGMYWRYETFLKKCEGRLGALLGSNGAISAIRRDVFVPLPADTIADDFVIPLLAKLRHGCSIIYDSSAIGREETPAQIREEFHRRVRIGAAGFQAIAMLWMLLNPSRGWIAFTFFSHKIMRWLCPFFMCGALASAVLLGRAENFYHWALIGQAFFYAISMTIGLIPVQVRALRPLRLATMFTTINAALLLGFFKWAGGFQRGVWRSTERAVQYRQAA